MKSSQKKNTIRSFFRKRLTVEVRTVSPEEKRTLITLGYVLLIVGFILFLVILIQVVNKMGIYSVDHSVESWMDSLRNSDTTVFMIALAIVFGPFILPIIVLATVIGWFIRSRHAWRPLIFAGFMTFGLIIVQVMTRIVQRARPPLNLMLFGKDATFSFPSGHVLGTSDYTLLLLFLIISRKPTRKKIAFGVVIAFLVIGAQIISRIYLGYHWLSDTLSAVSIALFVLGLLILVDTRKTAKTLPLSAQGKPSKTHTERM